MINAPANDPSIERQTFWRDDALGGAWLMDARYRAHRFERHLHDEMVVVVTEQGSGEVSTRFGTDRSAPGTVWVFAAGEYHGGRTTGAGLWTYRALYLDANALDKLAAVYGSPGKAPLFVPPGLYRDPQLARALGHAHRLHCTGSAMIERQSHWWAAMEMLFGRYGEPKVAPPQAGREPSRLAIVRDYIEANFRRDIRIEDLSALSNLSRYHLIRSFRETYGLPPHVYTNQLRLIEAKRLLRARRAPAEVASAVGFYDQSHLTRQFKRAFALTPGAFARLG